MSAFQVFTKSIKSGDILETEVIMSSEMNAAADKERRELLEFMSLLSCLENATNIFEEATFFYKVRTPKL